MPGKSAVIGPNRGLYYGLDPLLVPQGALQDGRNFRIKQGKISNTNLGWGAKSAIDFGGRIMMVDNFRSRTTGQQVIVATEDNLFLWDSTGDTATYLNPIYATGTVDVSGANPAVVSVASGSPLWVTNGIAIGDKISFGSATEKSLTATWYTVASVDTESQITLTTAVVGAPLTGSTYTIRRVFSGTTSDLWDSTVFVSPDDGVEVDLWFATNGVDYVVSWDGGAGVCLRQSALGIKAKRLAVYKNMLIYAHVTQVSTGVEYTTSLINSDVGKPLNAGDAGTGLSEQFRVHDGADRILDVQPLGDNLVIYSERHVVLAQFVGDPLVFIFRYASTGLGPIASRAIMDFGDYHEFIGADSQYLFDGVSSTTVNQHVWREILRQRDPIRQALTFATIDEQYGDVFWAIPLTSDVAQGTTGALPEEAFVEHYLEQVPQAPTPFSRRNFPFACAGDSSVSSNLSWDDIAETWDQMVIRWNDSFLFSAFPTILTGDNTGTIHELNTVQTQGGSHAESYIITGRRATGDGVARNLLTRVYPFSSALNGTLNVTARLADHASGPVTISDLQVFDSTLVEGEFFTSHFRAGRFFELKFGSSTGAWELGGWDVEQRSGGRR